MTSTQVIENKNEISKRNDVDNPKERNDSIIGKVDYDHLLSAAGELGRYQILLFISTAPFYVFGVFALFSQLFMTEVSPNHWCWIPELENLTAIERRNLAIPSDSNSRYGYSQCYAFDANWTQVLETGRTSNDIWNKVPCQHGWEFNKTEIPYPTISSELGWVCDKDNYQAIAQSIFFMGSIVGGFMIGWISDRFGRLPAAVSSCAIGFFGGVLSTFARNFTEFVVCRFIMGVSYDNCMMMAYLIVLEYVTPKYRSLFANLAFAIFSSVTVTALPWIVLVCGHWKIISLVTSLPLAVGLFAPLFIPESPRWLLSRGRVDEAINKVVTIGRINRKEIPQKVLEEFQLNVNKNHSYRESILEVFKRPLVRRAFILICLMSMSSSMIVDVQIRSLDQFNFDYFTTFTLLSLTEFPSLILLAFTIDWLGRRWFTIIVMIISSVFILLTMFVSTGIPSVICAVISRFALNMSCNIVLQWAAEILPTTVRGTGASIVHICSFVATIISPYIAYLKTISYNLPLLIIGGIAFFGVVIAIFLPETANKDMPQTFDDAEVLLKNQTFWQLPKKQKMRTISMEVNNGFEL